MNKFSKPLIKINSTESYTRDMVLKFLPEPRNGLNIFIKLDMNMHIHLDFNVTSTAYETFTIASSHSN